MGLFGSHARVGASAAGDYEIERSLKFNAADSTYLDRTLGTATNRKIWTWSCWVKRDRAGTSECWFSALAEDSTSWYSRFADNGSGDNFEFTEYSGSSYVINLRPNVKMRDFSAWYHMVVAYDSTQGVAANRVKMYVNNVQITSFGTETYPSLNQESGINKNHAHTIGKTTEASSYYYGGYMSDMHFVDGQALTPASFGKTNAITGQWISKKYVGTYGNNGFYLNFSDNSAATATTLGKDSSGNSNNFTPNNLVTGDSVKDTPTNNFATLRMICTPYESGASISDGNLKFVSGSGTSARNQNKQAISSLLVNSGKWYAEIRAGSANPFFGVGPYQVEISPTSNNSRYVYIFGSDGNKYVNTNGSESIASYGSSYTTGDILGIYLDMDAGTPAVYFSKNGQWADGSGNFDESSPTSAITLGNDFLTTSVGGNSGYCGFIFSSSGSANNVNGVVNFGQDSTFAGQETAGGNTDSEGIGDFKYTVPTAAKALCTANLSTPTIKKGSDYFATTLFTGNGGTQTISSLNFQPDFVWFKSRTTTYDNEIYDAVRGVEKGLYTNTNAAEFDDDDALTAFNSNGFTVGDDPACNQSGQSIASWSWKESASAGFDIVTYTGDGNASKTISHNLGVVPEMILVKCRSETQNWRVGHKDLPNKNWTYRVILDNNSAAEDHADFNDTAPTSSVFTVGTDDAVNKNSATYVAYLFASVDGYSKVGSYAGNGNANGTFIYTGFSPSYFLWKVYSQSGGWGVIDSSRDPYNVAGKQLGPDDTDTEASYTVLDFLSNGIKMRNTYSDTNGSGHDMIYLAFAENPFKYANAR